MTDDRPHGDRARESRRATSNGQAPALEPWVVGLLACPLDLSGVRLNGSELVCGRCGRRYRTRAGIPCMLANQALVEQKF
jgi:uncharacterized protein YbaR (Trm112 family)